MGPSVCGVPVAAKSRKFEPVLHDAVGRRQRAAGLRCLPACPALALGRAWRLEEGRGRVVLERPAEAPQPALPAGHGRQAGVVGQSMS